MSTVTIIAGGQPVPWQRARRNGNRYFPEPKTAEYQNRVRVGWSVAGRPKFGSSPLSVTLCFVFERPPSHLKKDGSPRSGAPCYPPRCDADNLGKGPLDALQGDDGAFKNDDQVVELAVTKRYAIGDEEPHTLIELRPAGEP